MSKTYFKLDRGEKCKVVEITEQDFHRCDGTVDTMTVEVLPNKKRVISLDAHDCSLSELLQFLSKIK
jgi:Ni,Fe-hydrogenase maturation factor